MGLGLDEDDLSEKLPKDNLFCRLLVVLQFESSGTISSAGKVGLNGITLGVSGTFVASALGTLAASEDERTRLIGLIGQQKMWIGASRSSLSL